MSGVYVLAPPTQGKVVIVTTLGEIEVELFSKEAPKACRNFVQLALERYYDNLTWVREPRLALWPQRCKIRGAHRSAAQHRVIKDFMIQTGDPTGTGTGGESVYGEGESLRAKSLRLAHASPTLSVC